MDGNEEFRVGGYGRCDCKAATGILSAEFTLGALLRQTPSKRNREAGPGEMQE